MRTTEIKAVLFDLGDTLLNFGKVRKTSAILNAAQISYEYLKKMNQPVGSFKIYFIRNLLLINFKHLLSVFTHRDFDSLNLMKEIGQKHGFNLTEEQYKELNWLWYKPLSELATIEPDIKNTFEQLENMDLKLGVISNTFVHGSALDKHLENANIIKFLPTRLYSCDFPYRKPDKRIFLEAAKVLNTRPAEIVFVGDRLDTDIKGAKNSGMIPILKTSHANLKKQSPPGTLRIDNISELPDLIDKISH